VDRNHFDSAINGELFSVSALGLRNATTSKDFTLLKHRFQHFISCVPISGTNPWLTSRVYQCPFLRSLSAIIWRHEKEAREKTPLFGTWAVSFFQENNPRKMHGVRGRLSLLRNCQEQNAMHVLFNIRCRRKSH
jgi:hypothetical protein